MRKGLLTTNSQAPVVPAEPKKLNQITSNAPDPEAEAKGGARGIIPFAESKPEGWRPKGDGFAKMITTHDEPQAPGVGGYLKPGDIGTIDQSLKKGFEAIEQTKKDAAGLGVVIDAKVDVKVNEPIDMGADSLTRVLPDGKKESDIEDTEKKKWVNPAKPPLGRPKKA